MLGLNVRHGSWVCELAEAVGGGDEELCGRAAVEGPLEEVEVPAVPRRPRLEREDRPPTGKTADLQDLIKGDKKKVVLMAFKSRFIK